MPCWTDSLSRGTKPHDPGSIFSWCSQGKGRWARPGRSNASEMAPQGPSLFPRTAAYTSLQKSCEMKSLPFGVRTCESNTHLESKRTQTEPVWGGNLRGLKSCVSVLRFRNESSPYLPFGKLELDPSADTSSVNVLVGSQLVVNTVKCSVPLSEPWI